MALGTPDDSKQVEDRIKTDVQNEAVDSNPYLKVHWLRSLIAGIARRIFDFYRDLKRTEKRLFPDTADDETAPIWGNIYVGPKNSASVATGEITGNGNLGGTIGIGVTLTAGGNTYTTTTSDTVSTKTVNIDSLTRINNVATAITETPHKLTNDSIVTITGALHPNYNLTDTPITVTGTNSFTYLVPGNPPLDAGGTPTASSDIVTVSVVSAITGSQTNLAFNTPINLNSPIVDIDDQLRVTFGEIGGGTELESTSDYKSRYLDKIRNPVAHFNDADIIAQAKTVPGVTRVFVERAGTVIGTVSVNSITRSGNVAKAVTLVPHGFNDGQITSITGAVQTEYNVQNARIIIEDDFTFYYVVLGLPSSPATGVISATTSIPLGQVRTFFMRDNDDNPIPSASEVLTVKNTINEILPANTSEVDNIVLAPTSVTVNYVITNLFPNTLTMQQAIEANIDQFHEERVTVGVNVDEDAYRAAIINTIDPASGDRVETFDLASPVGDIIVGSGGIAVKGTVSF